MMMSDGSLSQAEIDALLQSSASENISDTGVSQASPPPAPTNTSPTPEPSTGAGLDATDIISQDIVPQMAKVVEGMLNAKCTLTLTKSEPLNTPQLRSMLDQQVVQIKHMIPGVQQGGEIIFLLSEDDAKMFASHIIGQEDLSVDDAVLHALQEAFSQINEPLLYQAGTIRGEVIEISSGESASIASDSFEFSGATPMLNTYQLSIEDKNIELYHIFDHSLIEEKNVISAPSTPAPGPALSTPQPAPASQPAFSLPTAQPAPPDNRNSALGAMGATAPPPPHVRPAALNDLSSQASATHHSSLDLLMDVEMQLTVELGQTRKQVREILQFGEGSIIELDKLAGEPVDIKVNQQLIAKGEVVVIDENFGVRITEILSPADRIRDVG